MRESNAMAKPKLLPIFMLVGVSLCSWFSPNAVAETRSEQLLRQFQQLSEARKNEKSNTTTTARTTSRPAPVARRIQNQRRAAVTGRPEARSVVTTSVEQRENDAAFKKMLKGIFPLSPDQITRLHARHEAEEKAIHTPVGIPPKPVATSKFINLSPGATPPVVRLAAGFVTSLVFVDSTGADWPIVNYDIGDPATFDIQWDKRSNAMMIQAKHRYKYGNMAVRLEGLSTPVMITLIPGQKVVDYRVDMRMPGLGPKATIPTIRSGLAAKSDDILLSVLDGVPPPLSKELRVLGGDAQAWLRKRTMYVRTRLKIISPGWEASMSSADGMHVYQMPKAPLILVSMHGRITGLKIEGLVD